MLQTLLQHASCLSIDRRYQQAPKTLYSIVEWKGLVSNTAQLQLVLERRGQKNIGYQQICNTYTYVHMYIHTHGIKPHLACDTHTE